VKINIKQRCFCFQFGLTLSAQRNDFLQDLLIKAARFSFKILVLDVIGNTSLVILEALNLINELLELFFVKSLVMIRS
jgi:hypothetical protein